MNENDSRPRRRRRGRRGAGGQQGGGEESAAAGASARGRRRRGTRPGGGTGGRSGGGAPLTRPEGEATLEVRGVLQLGTRGEAYLRSRENDYGAVPTDPVVPSELVERHALEDGSEVVAIAVAVESQKRGPWVESITSLDGMDPEAWAKRTPFKNLVADTPEDRIRLEHAPEELSTRVVDLVAPIGKGQRCLIVAPPKAGKTVLLQQMAHAISENHPEIELFVLLVDERPEEVTDWQRTTRGEVIASSSDELARNHVRVAEVLIERAKRLVEAGRDVVVLLDSITRLSRAYNAEQKSSGRVLSGGIDARTMEKPRRLFGAARNVENGGSLTVIGTALVDTGSRMDEVIFQEFKGTGNTEIVMDRKLFERRIYPCIDISQTGTRREEKLFTAEEYQRVTILRRALAPLRAVEAMQLLVERLGRTKTNAEFLSNMLDGGR